MIKFKQGLSQGLKDTVQMFQKPIKRMAIIFFFFLKKKNSFKTQSYWKK